MDISTLKIRDRLIVRNGARGTQVAVATGPSRDGGLTVRAHKWLRRGARWTKPVTVYAADVLGFATPDDFRKRGVKAAAPIGDA